MPRGQRWMIGLVGGTVVLTLLGLVAWFVWVPSWRPPLRDGETYGIDVASHQGEIDWSAVASDDIRFAYVKATEGGDFVDRSFEANWRGAGSVGLDRGPYHFFTLCTPGAVQAQHFLDVAPPEPEALAPAVDLELAGNCSRRPTGAEVEAELDRFIGLVEAAWGRPLVLYVGDDWDRRYPVRTRLGRPLWHRRLLRRPDLDGWVIWQVHGRADIDGIRGPVDLNVKRSSA